LRIRVSMSAIGSVIPMSFSALPTGLDQSGNMALAGVIAQAQAAHAKTAVKGPRPAAQRAAIVFPHFEFIRSFSFDSQTGLGQWRSPP
jgi:hypothetical protein